jgi:large subunit ribosomal protein L32
MAVPKQRISKARTRRRRAQWKAAPPTYAACPRCHEPIRPHHVCRNCGFYKGRTALEVD